MTESAAISTNTAPRNLIAGQWSDAFPIPNRWTWDPNTGEQQRLMVTTPRPQVEAALAAAHQLHCDGSWRDVTATDRALFLHRVADLVEQRVEEIARLDAMTSGVPISSTRTVAGFVPFQFRRAAATCLSHPSVRNLSVDGRVVRLRKLPWGPAAVLTPWNAPSFIAASKLASALAAGCPVLFKPSEWAANTADPISEAVTEALALGGLPSTALQTIHGLGDVGATLVADPRVKVVSFTGGQTAGRSIARAAAENFTVLQLELGGNNPVLVLQDADVDATAASLARGMTLLNGQWCEGPGKVLAHFSLAGALVEALTAELAKLIVGHSLSTTSDVGPLVHVDHRDQLVARISDFQQRGATIVQPIGAPVHGAFLAPTLAVGLDANVATEELFGPVMTVHALASDDAILHAANEHPSGLDAYVYGSDVSRAVRIGELVASGEVRVNGAHLDDLADGSSQSFWGSSGIGGHGPDEAYRVFSGDRVVGVDGGPLHVI